MEAVGLVGGEMWLALTPLLFLSPLTPITLALLTCGGGGGCDVCRCR